MPGSEDTEDGRISGVDGFAVQESHSVDDEMPNHQRRGDDEGPKEHHPAVDIRLFETALKEVLSISP